MDYNALFFLLLWVVTPTSPFSIEKHILDSAKSADMFDLFHVMPDGEMKVIRELDMVLSLDQYKQLYMQDNHHHKHKRKATADITTRWTDCIVYYEITESLDTKSDKAIIKEAMEEWEKYTCLEFREDDKKQTRIKFEDGDTCSSEVGMQKKAQTLHLASGCRTKGIIVHEIGHAIGWYHEHMRPDRDDYINIDFDRIPDKYKASYKKYTTDFINTYNVGYGYDSIMHYDDSSFPDSMVAIDPRYQDIIGQRDGFSFKDIKLANVMYDCAKVTGCPIKDCGPAGFQLYKSFKGKDKCECWCDSGDVEDPLILCPEKTITEAPPPLTLPPPTTEPPMECMDVREDCERLKDKCMTKMVLMKSNCAKTCRFCDKGADLCMDLEAGCGVMSSYCNDPGLKATKSDVCKGFCNLCQRTPDPYKIYHTMMGDTQSSDINNTAAGKPKALVWVLLGSLAVATWLVS